MDVDQQWLPVTAGNGDNQMELMDLPDDCLYSILCHLDLPDLISVADTCTRLQNIARRVFKRHPESKRLDMLKLVESFEPIATDKLVRLRFFENFGDLIKEISLDFDDWMETQLEKYQHLAIPIFKLIASHCGGGKLRALRLRKVQFDLRVLLSRSNSPNSPETQRLFSQLEKIQLDECGNISDILSASKECVNLSLRFSRNAEADAHFNFDLPRLKSFTYSHYYKMSDPNHNFHIGLEQFLERHPNLVALKLTPPPYDIDRNVIGRLQSLQTLHFDAFDNGLTRQDLRGLVHLPGLKKLSLYYGGGNVYRFMKESASAESMEHLELDECEIDDDFVDGLNRFRNLRTLKLSWVRNLNDDHFKRLRFDELKVMILEDDFSDLTKYGIKHFIRDHRKLQTIKLNRSYISIDHQTYERIAEICKNQNRKLTMKCSSRFPAFLADSNFKIEKIEENGKDEEFF